MDYLQYRQNKYVIILIYFSSFKPYYKWITFNTVTPRTEHEIQNGVLNLIINGLPSIRRGS